MYSVYSFEFSLYFVHGVDLYERYDTLFQIMMKCQISVFYQIQRRLKLNEYEPHLARKIIVHPAQNRHCTAETLAQVTGMIFPLELA